jgi:tight adherence protein C
MTLILFLAGLFLVAVAGSLLVRAVAIPRLRAEDTLGRIDEYGFTAGAPTLEQEGRLLGPLDPLAAAIGAALTVRFGTRRANEARKQLAAAGLFHIDPRKLIGYQAISGAAMLLLWLWVASGSFSTLFDVVGTAACGYIGFILPMVVVKRRARARLEDIEYDLPELIDLLVVAVEAGLGFSAALKAGSDRLKGPLGEEMRLALQEQNMGLSAIEALKNVLKRAETPALRSFVRAIIQGEQLGISIGQVLRNLAEEMRKRRKAAAEERAQKAPIKMLFPLIFLIFPAMFVILLGPAVFAFLDALG